MLGFRLRLAQAEELNLDPLRQWQEPTTAVPVQPTTGPVVITIEYIIHETDILEFLKAMTERRRIRRRDGALHWTLLRDLADPQIWIERYETPTWLDYIRHNNRLTQDDATVPERDPRAAPRQRQPAARAANDRTPHGFAAHRTRSRFARTRRSAG